MTDQVRRRPTGTAHKQLSTAVPAQNKPAQKAPAPEAATSSAAGRKDDYVEAKCAAAPCCGQSPCRCGGVSSTSAEGNAPPGVEALREHSLLKAGANGIEVRDLQARLGLQATGTFDKATRDAVIKYQTEKKLRVDGRVGQQTWGHLMGINAELKPGTDLLRQPEPAAATEPTAETPPMPSAKPESPEPAKPAPTAAKPAPTAAKPPATPASTGAVASLFSRIDGNHNGALTAAEVRAMVQRSGVGGGLFGGMKIDGATTQLMGQFDGNSNGAVNPRELRSGLQKLLTKTLGTNATKGNITPKTLDWFNRIDANHNGSVTERELGARLQAELERKGEAMASIKAEVLSKIGVNILGGSRAGAATRQEVARLAEDLDVG